MAKQDDRQDDQSEVNSMWKPLRHPMFRAFWLASLVSNIGTWMQDVAGAWLMTSFAPSPTMVALVQVATNLPMFLLAIPAGALADVVDRRRLLLVTQTWQLMMAFVLGLLVWLHAVSAWGLLGPCDY